MSNFVAQHITHAHTIHLPATPQQIFPLFSPLGEKHWAHDWNPEMLYPSNGAAQAGTVFKTQHADQPDKIWTIVAYAQEQAQLSYVNVLPDSHLSRIDICCEPDGARATIVHIAYTLTALTPQGNLYLDEFTEEHYQSYIASWETAINDYLLHGHIRPLRLHQQLDTQ